MPIQSSFPKRTFFHKLMGTLALVFILASMGILAAKRCTQATAPEALARKMREIDNPAQIKAYVASYFYKLHILHAFALTSAFLIVLLSFVDLVPQRDDDIKFAFHFVSVFGIFCVSLATMYAAFIAFERPCLAPDGTTCCTLIPSPGLLSSSDRQVVTSISVGDVFMIAIMVLDLFAGTLQLLVAIVYFRDVRNEAERCGYLHRVHNEGYIIRQN